jgi:alpha-galactosidase
MKKYIFFLVSMLTMLSWANDSAAQTISITTRNTQLVMKVKDNGRLYQTYLGPRLSATTDLEQLDQPVHPLTATNIKGCEVYPVMGTEDYYDQPLEIKHADGNPTSVLKYVSHSSHAVNGGTETVITLKDDVYPLTVKLHYVVYEAEDVVRQWTEIEHQEKGAIMLGRYASSMLWLESDHYYLTEFASDWAKEMQMKNSELNFGKKIVDSRLGARANMLAQPYFEVGLDQPVAENEGTVLMGTLAWSGNFRFCFEVDHDNVLRVLSGINPDASTFRLEKGKVFRTPDFIFTLSTSGAGEGSRRLQKWALNYQVDKGQEDRLTLLNNWENTYFDFDEAKLTKLFGEARDLGVDMFLLDDGWFGNKYPRKSDNAALGDWQVTKEKLPHGLPYLTKTAKDSGVVFGLWIEPEMVSPKSELAEKHPDWIVKLPKREPYYFRNQLVLDLANPKVQDYVFGIVDNILKENPDLKFFKWDCNSPITNVYSPWEKYQGNFYVDYVNGLYSVLQRIQQRYPDIRMMMCSGGGGRVDYGGLRYFTEFWCSDNTNPVDRLYIQWGYSHFMPSKTMCAHVTNWNSKAPIKFRVDVAFACKLGFDINFQQLQADEKTYCRQAIKEYNRLKPVIYSPNLYRLVSPYDGNHCAFMRINDDKSHAVVFAYDIHPLYGEKLMPVRLQGLDPDARYHVKEISMMPNNGSWLSCNDKTYSGDYLMKVGIPVLSSNDMTSHIIELNRQ